jgi:hypothetical protein
MAADWSKYICTKLHKCTDVYASDPDVGDEETRCCDPTSSLLYYEAPKRVSKGYL